MISSPQSSVPALAFQDGSLSDIRITEMAEIVSAYYLRITALDKVGVLAHITQILGECEINIEAIIQKEPRGADAASQRVPVIILTREILEATMNTAIARIEKLDGVAEKVMRIRVFKLE
jgi:homoserine dehydrogenase